MKRPPSPLSRRTVLLGGAALACLYAAAAGSAMAQQQQQPSPPPSQQQQAGAWPQRPVTLVVGYPPGGSTDLVARTLATDLSARLGQPVVIENLGGAGGSLGAQKVALAAPDGYTLLVGANNELAINALVRRSVKYQMKNFTPLALLASQPLVLTAAPASGVKNTADFLRVVRARPGFYSYGSSGVGTSLHMTGEMVKQQGGLFMTHIPYRGTGPLTNDLIGGNLDFGVYVLSSALPLLKAGKLVAIGTSETRRAAVTPEVPALAENPALKNVDISVWFALLGPAGLPEPVQARLRSVVGEILRASDFRRAMEASGSVVPAGQPDLGGFVASETAKYRKIVDYAHITDE